MQKLTVAVLSCLFAIPFSSFAETKDPKAVIAEIDAQIARGKSEYRACGKFKKKFKKIVPGGLTIESPSHLNKKQALDYLAVLEKYPAPAQGFRRAALLFQENIDVLLQEPDQVALLKRNVSIEEECAMFSLVVHATLLMRDVKAFGFGKKEKAKVEKFARQYLRASPFDGLVTAGVKAKVLEAYLENVYDGGDKDALLARARALATEIDAKRAASFEHHKSLKGDPKSDTLEFYRVEWQSVAGVSAAYAQLARDAKL